MTRHSKNLHGQEGSFPGALGSSSGALCAAGAGDRVPLKGGIYWDRWSLI